jgi:lysozyme
MMNTDEAAQAVALAKTIAQHFEGLHRIGPDGLIYPYLCPAGFPTIAWGHLLPSIDRPPVTREQAEALLDADMGAAVLAAARLCPVLASEPPQRLAAVGDFVFNLGAGRLHASTLRRRINQKNWTEAARELRRWVRGGGRVLPGLVARREAEVALFLV